MSRLMVVMTAVVALAATGAAAKYAYASSNKAVDGQGTGSITCTPGGPAFPATINFNATLNKGSLNGFFQIFGGAVNKFGSIVSGSVSTNSYSLTGNETFAVCPSGNPAPFPATFTLGRDCGIGVVIKYTASNGERGAFVGNVACST